MSRLWPLLIGFGLWALGFVTLYGLQALGCLYGWPMAMHRLALAGVALATLGALGLTLLLLLRDRLPIAPPMRRTGIIATGAAVVASVLNFFPLAFVSICI